MKTVAHRYVAHRYRDTSVASHNPNASLNVVYVVMSNVAMNSWVCTGGCQLRVENKIVPIEISSKIGQMLYEL